MMGVDYTQLIITVISLLFAGGLGSFVTVKFVRKKAEAEAMSAVQDVYQETIQDLRSDKQILKTERDDMSASFRELQLIVLKNTKDIEDLKILLKEAIRERDIAIENVCVVKKCSLRKAK